MKSEVIEALLDGQFICAVSNEDAYEWLSNEINRQGVNVFLDDVKRGLAKAGDAYYVKYTQLGDKERKAAAANYRDVVNALEPAIRWIRLTQEARNDDMPLRAGDPIKGALLIEAAERMPAVRDELGRVSKMPFFNCTSDAIDAQVKQTLSRLTKSGYLLQPSPDRQHFIVTGKVSYLYEVLDLINQAGALGLESLADPDGQGDLGL